MDMYDILNITLLKTILATHKHIILLTLKTIYKKILSKSPTKGKKEPEKDKQMNRNKGRNELENSTKKFDTPIIFESNNFDEIIKKIRNMANDQNRQAREKKYLKSLLPKF